MTKPLFKHKLSFRNRFFWWVYFLFIFGNLAPVGTITIFFSLLFNSPSLIPRVGKRITDLSFKIVKIKIIVHGEKNIPKQSKGFFVVSNHQSFLDTSFILNKIGIIGFIAKSELSKIPFFKYCLLKSSCIFINRKDLKSMKEVIKTIKKNVAKGKVYAFFPEGSRTLNGKILPFKKGMLRIAYDSQTPILPLSINSWKTLPKKPRVLTSHPLIGTIHSLLYPHDFENFNQFADKIRETIKSGLITT